ncbi:unnamed protein product [Clonostachys byssicola]|uniref:Uncharacterized protein n=1 Tax=Clonostachys byssicola TaxID=160290 RepID=A0A9N9UG46_9HYPO|nr:unnamed protein product [Clonostachys byssicola]
MRKKLPKSKTKAMAPKKAPHGLGCEDARAHSPLSTHVSEAFPVSHFHISPSQGRHDDVNVSRRPMHPQLLRPSDDQSRQLNAHLRSQPNRRTQGHGDLSIRLAPDGVFEEEADSNAAENLSPGTFFYIATDDLEFLYRAADSVVSNPPSKNEASKSCALYCGRKRLPQIHRTNLRGHFLKAYRYELYLVQAFRDRMVGLSFEVPSALIPPVTMEQVPVPFPIRGPPPPPQQQPVPMTIRGYVQMGF